MTFQFATKGQTLARVRSILEPRGVLFCDQILFTVGDWQARSSEILAEIAETFADMSLAVRSSSLDEDSWTTSNAGRYTSLTSVASSADAVDAAVTEVIGSYESDNPDNEILVQPMVSAVRISGVILTRDLATGGPYYTIDYDDETGSTTSITSGLIGKSVVIFRDTPEADIPDPLRSLVSAAKEIEQAVGHGALDIEFCVTDRDEFYLLQVRPLVARDSWTEVDDRSVRDGINGISDVVWERMGAQPGLGGTRTILGDMPDWNPAEMIGSAPRSLALSLYQRQITDRTWALARHEMGYRFIDQPLMAVLSGRPYIDVRLSLNSFLPADLDDQTVDVLVEDQINALEQRPELHDKIEFDIAITCFDFDLDRRLEEMADRGIHSRHLANLRDTQLDLTRRNVDRGKDGIAALLAISDPVIYSRVPDTVRPIDRVSRLLDVAITHGTLPFSKLARHAFISMSILKSLVAVGVLTNEDINELLASVSTVANDLVDALNRVSNGGMSLDIFLHRFGHLRPGTYDISSLRYDERPDIYFRDLGSPDFSVVQRHHSRFAFSAAQAKAIDRLLSENGFSIDSAGLLDYIRASIAAREEAKFNFTRGISDALRTLSAWGAEAGLSRSDLANIRFDEIHAAQDKPDRLQARVANGREAHRLCRTLRVPHLITNETRFNVIFPPVEKPNYITDKAISAPVSELDQGATDSSLDGRIVMIECADPGYDWIFSHNIAGLITLYGGANSHMAIRCAEFGLPAAIGCGNKLYEKAQSASWIELNCGTNSMSFH